MSAQLSQNMLLAVPLAPLIGAIAAGLFGKQIGRKGAHWITCIGVAISLAISVQTLLAVIDGARFNATIYEWMNLGGLKMEVGFLVDGLTAMMMCVVTFVSLMVHIYTIGYMEEDPGYQRFFSYISLFTFSMLMLVMSNNFLQLFFGWEAVGLVSYLLIGFWFTKPTAIFANMKAFLVNRVGDFGFILGIGLIVAYGNTLNYGEAFAKGPEIAKLMFPGTEWLLITVTCICLFIGAMGKSAQFPLHVWLPDSMEGPTPISALIHAATMVTAGIFMVARMSPLFELSDTALSFVMVIGAITALFMGFLGIIQNDIKRVVAYSTLSQLGYMTVALGASAYSVAVFHLMTHAFFKALLFLAAGSVIIGMHHDQDIRNMGGLRKYMPITWITALLGSLALIGTPLFSGFYSKDSIIEALHATHIAGAGFAYFAVMAGVFVTAFYSFRMYFLVFHGAERFHHKPFPPEHDDAHDDAHGHDDHHATPHESPWVITVPLILLAIPSVLIGYFTVEPMLFGEFFKGSIVVDSLRHPAMEELTRAFHGAGAMALHATHIAGAGFAYFAVMAGVFVTAFYSFRMYFLVFHGAERFHHKPFPPEHDDAHDDAHGHDDHHATPHESPWVITVPLILLAIPSVLIGYFTVEPMLFGEFFKGSIVVDSLRHPAMEELTRAFHGAGAMALHGLKALPFWLALAGVALAYLFYMVKPEIPAAIKARAGFIYRVLDNKYYFDWFNENVLARLARLLGTGLWKGGDEGLIDGVLINGSAGAVGGIAAMGRRLQTGHLYWYALVMLMGVIGLMTWFLWWRTLATWLGI